MVKNWPTETPLKITWPRFFDNKPQKFYNDGIMKLSEKWQKRIDNNGYYQLHKNCFSTNKNFVQNCYKKPRKPFI